METMMSSWKTLESIDQLEKAIEDSFNKPVVLFKHSVSCGISARAKYMLEENWKFDQGSFDFYYLDLLGFRNVSNEIADRFKVQHQSPQVIIIKNGEAVYDMSHHKISAQSLESAMITI
tara:strand:+ start:260 stop:616 length:357 start_codon:yes stop_codon:yes gene_type:complete